MQFSKEDVANLACVLIYSLTKYVLEDGFKDNSPENVLLFAENCPCQSVPLNKLEHVDWEVF